MNPAQDLMGYTQMRSSLTGPSHCAAALEPGLPAASGTAVLEAAAGASALALRALLSTGCEALLASSFSPCQC